MQSCVTHEDCLFEILNMQRSKFSTSIANDFHSIHQIAANEECHIINSVKHYWNLRGKLEEEAEYSNFRSFCRAKNGEKNVFINSLFASASSTVFNSLCTFSQASCTWCFTLIALLKTVHITSSR